MNIYEITNGWMGESYVRVYVIAATDERALELARERFRAERDDPTYYSTLYLDIVGQIDATVEVVSAPSDVGWGRRDE